MKVISFDNGVMVIGAEDGSDYSPAPSFNPTPDQQEAYARVAEYDGLDSEPAVEPNTPEPEPEPEPSFEPGEEVNEEDEQAE